MTVNQDHNWQYPGSRWWKFDFHTHTPASEDYGRGKDQLSLRQISPQDWLLNFMRAGIDCVAVTDHNSADWVDQLKEAYVELEQEQAPDFRPLHLFPGVEITADGNIHILAIFDTDRSSADVTTLLGAVGYHGERGASDVAANSAPIRVVEAITDAGGIPILAHVDRPAGAWRLAGNTLVPLLDYSGLFAMEVVDITSENPELYRQRKLSWAEILGSDSHHPTGGSDDRFPGSHYTWVKMERPSLEGLRLALLDGAGFSIRRSDDTPPFNPAALPEHFVEKIEIIDAQYIGQGQPAKLEFSPWLNALVGGRGTGKSTVVHALRLVSRRETELQNLDEHSEPRATFERFNRIPEFRADNGGLKITTRVIWTLTRDGLQYRVNWPNDNNQVVVEEKEGKNWKPAGVQTVTQTRFPLRIFSQGQISALAGENQQALLQVIDEAAEVTKLKTELEQSQQALFTLRSRIRELDSKLERKDQLIVEQEDVERKLKRFEEAGHTDVLKSYRLRNRQSKEADRQFDVAQEIIDNIEAAAEKLQTEDLPESLFDEHSDEERQVIQIMEALATAVRKAAKELGDSAQRLRNAIVTQREDLARSSWQTAVQKSTSDYDSLVKTLQEEGVTDPNEYSRLAQDRQRIDSDLKRLASIKQERDRLVKQSGSQLEQVFEARRAVSNARDNFLADTLAENDFVSIRNQIYGNDPLVIEQSLRQIINITDDRFQGDILVMEDGRASKGIVADMLKELPEEPESRKSVIEERINNLKSRIKFTCLGNGQFNGHFNNFLKREFEQNPGFLDVVLTWFPEDGLQVEYSRRGDGADFQPITQASAGQRSAAMLAFLLAYGKEPLVLDQPEDDLDNHLIYDLIVRQIRENKLKRQIIVVTHNPNIVVNGDAEMLHALDFKEGQCRVVQSGSLQQENVREEVCRVMEGGREAFKRRYRRLGREQSHV